MENSSYLGTEHLGTLLRKFAVPCIFSLIISCLYNICRSIGDRSDGLCDYAGVEGIEARANGRR